MKSRKLWVGIPLIILVFTVVFGVMLTSCDEQITEEQLLGEWYTSAALQSSEPRASFEFQSGKKVLTGGATYTYEIGAQNVFSFKAVKGGTQSGSAKFTFDESGVELTISNSDSPLKNGQYYQLSQKGSVTDTSVAPPSAYPPGGIYSEGQNVTLSVASDATIYYTTNGNDPNSNSSQYSSPISINSNTHLKAIAIKGGASSDVFEDWYFFTTSTPSPSPSDSVTSSADDGAGSLRDAIKNVTGDGSIITIANSVTTITLTSCLDIGKNIIIKGSGVTIAKASTGWTGTNNSLLNIQEGKTVSISGVRFKDGKEITGGLGGAIYNLGTLTLESCIFDNNEANYGGAVYSTSKSPSTTVRGCTFYNNKANKWGGAIYVGGGNLFLTGNLFYGNKGTEYGPIVDHSTATNAKVYTRGFNVVEIADGDGKNQCGWSFGETDARLGDGSLGSLPSTSPPFNVPAFTPSITLKNFITTAPANFPTTDFKGATRNTGVPGAVNATN